MADYKEGDVLTIVEKMFISQRGGRIPKEVVQIKLDMDPEPARAEHIKGLYAWGTRLNGTRKGTTQLVRTDTHVEHKSCQYV